MAWKFFTSAGAEKVTAALSADKVYSTSLPASPIDGQEAVLTDSLTAGTYAWRFRYNSSAVSAYKWDFIGGAPVNALVGASESCASTSYIDLASVGPSITLPRAGDYLVTFGGRFEMNTGNTAASQMLGYITVKLGASASGDTESLTLSTYTPYELPINTARTILLTGRAASDVLKLQYKRNTGTVQIANRFIGVIPVRVS